ncbi:restriction system protein [Nitrosomonas aestuarii]|uniref:Restriction system protein n=1 Tax=Nitrosomonas aestuarii TaxID=52441 RepID=A0A1I4G4U2_9PROT|nr:restriction endonuclease [Nitrosomonas aestuarii]SFL24809.1 restriction system protein [Nitrosomonas aestuarii]
MARRKTGLIEDILTITAALPWWIGIILAATAYVVLHHYAALELPKTNVELGQVGHMVVDQVGKNLAYYGQYILPALFLTGALVSFLRRSKRKNLVRTVDNDSPGNALRNINWKDFELFVGEIFRMRGYSVTETGGSNADGGIDLKLKKDNELFLVQCKQWRAYKVSVNVVRELLGVMVATGATGGFVVTSGVFTTEAHSFAKGQNIDLINGVRLAAMIKEIAENNPVQTSTKRIFSLESAPEIEISSTIPDCPKCGQSMVKRIAKKGANAGSRFWGCSDFPTCRGIRVIH